VRHDKKGTLIVFKSNAGISYKGILTRYDSESFLFTYEMAEGVWIAETLLYYDDWEVNVL